MSFSSPPLDGTVSSHYAAVSRGGAAFSSLTGAYILMRHCNPIWNLLCTANLVPPIVLVDEESFCHHAVSIATRSHYIYIYKKKINLSDLYCNGQLMSYFLGQSRDWEAVLLCCFCQRFSVFVTAVSHWSWRAARCRGNAGKVRHFIKRALSSTLFSLDVTGCI